jgi:peptidoglycan hydrolase CwlO-like protein
LEKGQRKENLLQMQIDQLQARLDDQQDLIGKLQSSMEKTNHLHAELEQAQKMALKLAEANQALIAENQSLKQPPEPPPSALQLSEPPRPDLRNQQEVLRQRQAARLSHPVFPNRPQASEPDVGWVD